MFNDFCQEFCNLAIKVGFDFDPSDLYYQIFLNQCLNF